MASDRTFVIAGAGLAGAKAAETLREEGFDGRIVLIGAETERPYERPPLSKGLLLGTTARDEPYVHPADWYAGHQVELRTGETVENIHRDRHTVRIGAGEELHYDKLLLATGAEPRLLPVPGGDTALTLRTFADSERIRTTIEPETSLVLIGAGWIGLEVAAFARQRGATVTVVESLDRPLPRVLDEQLSAVFTGLHREQGVEFRFGA